MGCRSRALVSRELGEDSVAILKSVDAVLGG